MWSNKLDNKKGLFILEKTENPSTSLYNALLRELENVTT